MTNNHIQDGAEMRAGALPRLLRVDEAAELLQVSKSHLYGEIQRGNIPCVRIGRSVRLLPKHVEEFIEANISNGGATWGT